ncbi:MAG: KOW motif-containing protein [Acidimicrobiia bacterium]
MSPGVREITSRMRRRPKRRDLVRVVSGAHVGRVGLVVEIDHRGVGDNLYSVRGHDDRSLGWFPASEVEIVEYRVPKRQEWVPLAAPELDAVDALLQWR